MHRLINGRDFPLAASQGLVVPAGCTAASLTVVSGTAGIVDSQQRTVRQEKDAGLAQALLTNGLPAFVETWYQQPMWQSLRAHARYTSVYCLHLKLLASRRTCHVFASFLV